MQLDYAEIAREVVGAVYMKTRPAVDLEAGEVGLPKLVDGCGLSFNAFAALIATKMKCHEAGQNQGRGIIKFRPRLWD